MKLVSTLICFFSFLQASANVEALFNGKTSIDKPFQMRDPFQPPVFKSVAQEKRTQSASGLWNNQKKLEGEIKLEDLKVTGVLIGAKRRVTVRVGTAKTSYTLKEGELIGEGGPEIKAILPGGIILAEKISNIYGEPEFIETVIPISE